MSAREGEFVRLSSTIYLSTLTTEPSHSYTYPRQYLTRQARSRGMAAVYDLWGNGGLDNYRRVARGIQEPFARVKLAEVRAALDALTLEDETEAYFKLYPWGNMGDYEVAWDPGHGLRSSYPGQNKMRATLEESTGRIVFTAPCGARRRYQVKRLDRALTALGY